MGSPGSFRFRLMMGGVLLVGVAALLVGVVPFLTCPGCDYWCRQVKASFRPFPTCDACDGTGRVSLLKKVAIEREMQRLKERGLLGP